MKTLVQAIQTQLRNDLNYVRDSDVFVTEDEALIPETCKFPAVGIKDGPVTRIELAGGMWEVALTVRLIAWVQLHKTEAAIIGDAAAGKKGVLEIAADVHSSLDENLLSIDGLQSAFSPSETESQFVGDEELVLQRKIITYQYTKEEVRP